MTRTAVEYQLQRECEQLLAELKAKLGELDRVRGPVSPEQRRPQLRVIAGGAS